MSSVLRTTTTTADWAQVDVPRQFFLRVAGEVMFWLVIMQLVAGAFCRASLRCSMAS